MRWQVGLRISLVRIAIGIALGCGVAILPFAAQAEDFFSALFGGFAVQPPPPPPAPPFASPFGRHRPVLVLRRHISYGGGQAWCVRSCDGRYFPVSGDDNKTRVETCNSFCPASKTSLVYGHDIDSAVTENGQPYSELPNAFRYRNELVAGCTCNGKDQVGLAPISIDDDPTLRKGDILAGAKGLEIAMHDAADRHGRANFSPLPQSARASFRHLPVVASGQ